MSNVISEKDKTIISNIYNTDFSTLYYINCETEFGSS